MIWVWNGDEVELVNSSEVSGIAGVERKLVRDGYCRNEGVVHPRGGLSARSSQGRCHTTEGAGCACVKGQGVEVGFGLLQVRLPGCSLIAA